MKTPIHHLFIALTILVINFQLTTAFAQGSAFSYQGRLNSGTTPVSGRFDLTFMVYDSDQPGGNLIAGPLTNNATLVSNGLFTTTMDFGAGVFTGTNYWLQIGVQTNGGSGFITLSPRQQLTPTPYAIFAATAGNVSGTISGVFNGNGSGLTNLSVTALPGDVALLDASQTFSGNNNFIGNVGMGTTSPSVRLSLGGDNAVTKLAIYDGGKDYNMGFGVGIGQFLFHVPDTNNRFSFLNSPTGTEVMTIQGAGNVGIGVINPQSSLQVAGGVLARGGPPGAYGSNNNGYAFSGNGGDNDSGIFSTNDGLVQIYNNSNEAMRIVNGNVGIGVANPVALFEARTPVDTRAAVFSGPGGGGWSTYKTTGSGNPFLWDFRGDTNGYAFGRSGIGTDFFMSYASGNLGIGTTTPGYKLDVAGTIHATGGLYVNGSSVLNNTADSSSGNITIGENGVYGDTKLTVTSSQPFGLYVTDTAPGGTAGTFIGNVAVSGTLSKGAGSFKIDHPLDPENKWLYHSFVESPDMMNVYNGNVVTDAAGDATVSLPSYFQALNKDYRYQLTVIGQFAQAMVSSEISSNAAGIVFGIKTDKPGVKVSWQVTGIRQDAFANAHRIIPEVAKTGGEIGTYVHPLEYNQPESKRMKLAKPQTMQAASN